MSANKITGREKALTAVVLLRRAAWDILSTGRVKQASDLSELCGEIRGLVLFGSPGRTSGPDETLFELAADSAVRRLCEANRALRSPSKGARPGHRSPGKGKGGRR